MRALVLLAICTQASATGTYGGTFDTTMALLQTTVLHQTARNYARRHTLESTMDQTKQLIHLLDVDNDGKVSSDEVNTFATANGLDPRSIANEFAGVDTNGNGTLEQEEIAALLSSSPEQEDSSVQVVPSIEAHANGKQVVDAPSKAPMLPVAKAVAKAPFVEAPAKTVKTQASPVTEAPAKAPLLKAPSATALTVTQVKPKVNHQPPEGQHPQGDVEEYFAQVPMATVQAESDADKSTRTTQDLVTMATDKLNKADASGGKKSESENTITDRDIREMQDLSPEASGVEDPDSAAQMMLHQGSGNARSVGPAISATQKMAERISSEVAESAQSMTFQAAASTLRANATALLLHAELESRAAAQKVADEVTMKNLKEINKLQSRAAKAEMRAAALRARASVEMKEAYAAVAVASSSMAKIGAKKHKA